MSRQTLPAFSLVKRRVKFTGGCAEVDAFRLQAIRGHGVAQDTDMLRFVGRDITRWFPAFCVAFAAIDEKFAAFDGALLGAFKRNEKLVAVAGDDDREAKGH